MSDHAGLPGDEAPEPSAPAASAAPTAGSLLRAAREAQGLHLDTLAALLKVAPTKLEALEADRYGDLQGATFVRALAQAACRALKVDPTPVLLRLPRPDPAPLGAGLGPGLNTAVRQGPGRRESADSLLARHGVLLLVLLLVVAAAGLWLWPRSEAVLPVAEEAASAVASASAALDAVAASVAPVASAASAVAAGPSAPAQVASSPAEVQEARVAGVPAVPAASEPPPQPTGGRGMVQLRAVQPTWVEVLDAGGQSLVGRILHPGEMVNLEGALPLRVKVGNVSGTELVFQGRPVDLKPLARDNVARLELK